MEIPKYQAAIIESKWQKWWEDQGLYNFKADSDNKLYCLTMFSYPSGDKLHIGHWYNFGPADTWARFKRLQGFDIFEPMGFDAFGLPAENFAIKHGIHPADSTDKNTATMERQLRAIGAMYDWNKKVDTSKPEYYKWTQWVFLQLYKEGLAYRAQAPVNWCPGCSTVLANEQVIDGCCERCDSKVERKNLKQWFFRITKYAQRLLDNIPSLNWPDKTKQMQNNWIGRSEGALIDFPLEGKEGRIKVFTTRPDTLMGVTYLVMSPENPLIDEIVAPSFQEKVSEYKSFAASKSEIDRMSTENEKTGVPLGIYCTHPISGERIPVWTGDYVIASYGTGSVMAVPAHDERDFEFAQKYSLPIKSVIRPTDRSEPESLPFVEPGIMYNSKEFDGLKSEDGKKSVGARLEKLGLGSLSINYRLRDWLISRQRYWGAPIPIIYCEKCGEVPVPEQDLPVLLPRNVEFKPDGKSPLAQCHDFIHVKCPVCGASARREADTMDTFVCSSWYYLRYPSAELDNMAFDPEITKKWLPVDMYIGGAEHACMHLLYARFFTMALHDMGFVDFEEPFTRLIHQGCITSGGEKMSKSRGNVVSPDAFVQKYGADTFRMYLMFMGDYTEGGDWSDVGITGIERFLKRAWKICLENMPEMAPGEIGDSPRINQLRHVVHRTIKAVSRDLEELKFNTAISRMMELVTEMIDYGNEEKKDPGALQEATETLMLLLAPFAPHFSEELHGKMGGACSVFERSWPQWEEKLAQKDIITYAIQINGKLRDTIEAPKDMGKEDILNMAKKSARVQEYLTDYQVIKEIFVPGRIVNYVVKKK